MDANTIITLVGSLGFPIVACIYMAYINEKQSQRHAEESAQMTSAINELRIAINSLIDKLS